MFRRHSTVRSLAVIVAALALAAAACGGGGDTSDTTAAPGGGDTTTTTAGGSGDTTTTTVGQTTTTAGETTTTTLGVPSLSDIASDATLEDLLDLLGAERFRQRMAATIESDNPDMSGSFEALYEFVSDPESLHLTFNSDQAGASDTFELISIGTDTWLYDGVNWEQIPADFANLFTSSATIPLAGALTSNLDVYGEAADYVGRENVNGRATLHYRFDESTLPPEATQGADVDKFEGDVWVDEDKGFMVKAEFKIEGLDPEDGEPFNMMMTIEVFDIDGDFTIEPPE